MMNKLVVAAAFCLCASAARADIPPRDESCKLEKVKKAGEECQSARPYYGDPDRGKRELGGQGYEFRCRTWGASVWTEIWCKAAKDPKAEK
jgi:hypothetical protein